MSKLKEHIKFLKKRITSIFNKDETYEDGMFNSISHLVNSYILIYGVCTLYIIEDLYEKGKISAESVGEACRWIGRLVHEPSRVDRRDFLIRLLGQPDHYIKDGALIGLTALGDADCLKALRWFALTEKNSDFKTDIENVIKEIENEFVTT